MYIISAPCSLQQHPEGRIAPRHPPSGPAAAKFTQLDMSDTHHGRLPCFCANYGRRAEGAIKHYPWLAKFLMLIGLFILSGSLSASSVCISQSCCSSIPYSGQHRIDQQRTGAGACYPMVHALEVYQFCTSLGRSASHFCFCGLWRVGGSFLQLKRVLPCNN